MWSPYRIAFFAFLLACAALSIASLLSDSDVLSDVVTALFGLLMIGVFARDLRGERQSPRYRLLLQVGLVAGVVLVVSVVGDRLT